MISKKMQHFVSGSSAIRAMFEEGKRLASIYGAENVFDYSLGNPSVEPPLTVKKAIYEILENEKPNYIHGYTNNSGYESVREFVATATNEEFGTHFTLENVIMTNGAAAALNIILKCILDPGDEVVVFAPFFGEYKCYIENYDGVVVVVPPEIKTFQVNLEAFEASITSKTRAVIVNTPNNPTGVIYSEETIKAIAEILERKQSELGTSIYLISDEPYRRLVFDGFEVPFISKYYKNTFIAYSFSKALSLPGERIGYLIGNSEMDCFEDILFALNVANRISGFVNANSLFQLVLPYCMNEKVDLATYDTNRIELYNKLTEFGYECVKPNGAFYMFPKSIIADDKEFCNAAKEFNILIVPGSAFGCPGHFRISYCVSHDTIVNSLDGFEKLAKKFQR